MNLLKKIFNQLNSDDLDILKSSTLMLMIDRVYLIKREKEKKNLMISLIILIIMI